MLNATPIWPRPPRHLVFLARSLALLNAGLAHENRQEWDLAVGRYRKVSGSKAPAEHVVDALMRIGVVDSERKRWGDASVTFEQLLGRTGSDASRATWQAIAADFTRWLERQELPQPTPAQRTPQWDPFGEP